MSVKYIHEASSSISARFGVPINISIRKRQRKKTSAVVNGFIEIRIPENTPVTPEEVRVMYNDSKVGQLKYESFIDFVTDEVERLKENVLNYTEFETLYSNTELSEIYTEEFGVPIIIVRGKRYTKLSLRPEIDAIHITAPLDIPMMSDEVVTKDDDRRFKLLSDTLEEWIEEERSKYESRELVIQTTLNDLQGMTDSWANKAGVEIGTVKLSKSRKNWGTFRCYDNSDIGDIFYSYKLQFLPHDLAESTVVHEVVHAIQWQDAINRFGGDIKRAYDYYTSTEAHGYDFKEYMSSLKPNWEDLDKRRKKWWELNLNEPIPSDVGDV